MPWRDSSVILAFSVLVSSCTTPRCGRDLTALDQDAAFAVALSDYASSAVALLDADGDVIEPAWVTSATTAPLLVTAVSGDVVLPQSALGRGRLAWIDRYSVDVLTLVAMPGGAVLAQHDLRGDVEGARTGFSPNPQDALVLPDGRVLISRLNPNPDRSADAVALGNDLVALDTESGVLTHVELGCDVSDARGTTFFARPAEVALLSLGGRAIIVAGMARLDHEFHATGGAVAVVDAHTLAPLGCLELAPLQNCTAVAAEPDAPSRVVVLCSGPTFAGADERRTRAGVVRLELTPTEVIEIARFEAAVGEPVASGGLVATGGGHAIVVADPRGDAPGIGDRLLDLDLDSGRTRVLAVGDPFAFGAGSANPSVLLVPDASRSAILRFDLVGGAPMRRDEVPVIGCARLPPRQVAPIGP